MIELKSIEEAIEFKAPPLVQITSVTGVCPTPKSDRLHNFTVAGGWTIFSSNINQDPENGINGDPRYKVGDKVIYFSIDTVLTPELEEILCANSKMKMEGRRIRIAKLRSAYSEGLIAEIDELSKHYPEILKKKEGEELADILGVVKYEPPVSSLPSSMRGGNLAKSNPCFRMFMEIRNIKHYLEAGVFQPGEEVYVTAKLHGTSARFGILPTHVAPVSFASFRAFFKTFKKQVLKKLGMLPKFEYCLGSRRCQLQNKPKDYHNFYESEEGVNVWQKVSQAFKIESKLKPGEILFGEIVGQGLQKNYDYGFGPDSKNGRYGFFAYDVMVNGRYLPAREFLAWCNERGFTPVPVLGFMGYDIEKIYELAGAKTCLNNQKIREGVVVKSVDETSHPSCGRRTFKVLNPEYLMDKNNTDFH